LPQTAHVWVYNRWTVMYSTHLDRVEFYTMHSINTPCECANGVCSTLIPDIKLLTTCCKGTIFPVMINTCKHCLKKIQESHNNFSMFASLLIFSLKIWANFGLQSFPRESKDVTAMLVPLTRNYITSKQKYLMNTI
jgi:hypothetical protein